MQLLVMSFRSAEYGAFQRTGGRVILVSRYRALTVAYAVSGTLAYLPSLRHRERPGRIQKDAGDELFLQLPLFG